MNIRLKATRDFRNALGQFATGVTVVTTLDRNGNRVGMTANSFSSVSMDPMLVLWSIGKSSSSFNVFHNADKFAIHVLSADQRAISQQFASKQADRFAGVESTTGYGGLPLLTDYAALFQCDVEHRYEGGDHLILVGRVADFDVKHSHPLIFHSGRYLAPETSIQH